MEDQAKPNDSASFINTSSKSLFINTQKDFMAQKSVRSKSRKGLAKKGVDTPCSLQNGIQSVDALLICELEQKISEMK
jgi:hypothetical protein